MFRIFENLIEAINWLKIAASPFLVGCVFGVISYLYKPSPAGIVFALTLVAAGLIFGILLATNISRKTRPSEFNSRINRFPEADDLEQL